MSIHTVEFEKVPTFCFCYQSFLEDILNVYFKGLWQERSWIQCCWWNWLAQGERGISYHDSLNYVWTLGNFDGKKHPHSSSQLSPIAIPGIDGDLCQDNLPCWTSRWLWNFERRWILAFCLQMHSTKMLLTPFCPGDEILSVNGMALQGMSHRYWSKDTLFWMRRMKNS